MPKGFFTQSACILLSTPTSLDAVVPLLSEFQIAKRIDEPTELHFGGPSLILSYRPEVNGYAKVDVRDGKWPDQMGDPEKESMLFAAWSMGHYGPLAFPGNLQRAQQQLWAWPEGKDVGVRHHGLIHISTSYVFGVPPNVPIMPSDYAPLPEIQFVTRMAMALLKHPDALAYFNPNGEVLSNQKLMQQSLEYHAIHQIPPFDLWSNIRLLNPNNGWMIMDTVGMGQLDRPDLEACSLQSL
jgi:hypothetical protein